MYNEEIKSQVEKVINENLPAIAAKQVVERLSKIDEFETKFKLMEEQLKKGNESLKEATDKLCKIQNIESREKSLVSGEEKLNVDLKDFEYEKKIFNLKIEHLKQQKDDVFNLANAFFSGPVKMTTITKNGNEYKYNNSGQSSENNSINENTTITEK